MRDITQREKISIVDAVVRGQGEGTLAPDPLETGAIFAVRNPVVGDFHGAQVSGLDASKIPLLRHACEAKRWLIFAESTVLPTLDPPFPLARELKGWAGHIEISQN